MTVALSATCCSIAVASLGSNHLKLVLVPMQVDVSNASNVLDRWINAASRSLTSFVTEEMNGYRLYTVVPVLVKFINNLTNIYVRYNRRRLKGSKGTEDTLMALVSLYDVLLTVCKVGVTLFCPSPVDIVNSMSPGEAEIVVAHTWPRPRNVTVTVSHMLKTCAGC